MTRWLRRLDVLLALALPAALSALSAGCAPIAPSAHQYATPYQPPLA